MPRHESREIRQDPENRLGNREGRVEKTEGSEIIPGYKSGGREPTYIERQETRDERRYPEERSVLDD